MLRIFDALGRNIITLIDENLSAGAYQARWNARDAQGLPVASGVYYYALEVGPQREMRKMTLLR